MTQFYGSITRDQTSAFGLSANGKAIGIEIPSSLDGRSLISISAVLNRTVSSFTAEFYVRQYDSNHILKQTIAVYSGSQVSSSISVLKTSTTGTIVHTGDIIMYEVVTGDSIINIYQAVNSGVTLQWKDFNGNFSGSFGLFPLAIQLELSDSSIPTIPSPTTSTANTASQSTSVINGSITSNVSYTLLDARFIGLQATIFRQIKDSNNVVQDLKQQNITLKSNDTIIFINSPILNPGTYKIESYLWANFPPYEFVPMSTVSSQNITIGTPLPTTNDAVITISQYTIVGGNEREILILSNKIVDNSWIVELNGIILINGNGLNPLSNGYGIQVGLQQGTNTIRVKNITNNIESSWSNTLTQTYSTQPPPTAVLTKRVVVSTKCGVYTIFMLQNDYDRWIISNQNSTLQADFFPNNQMVPNSLTFDTLNDVTFTPNLQEQLGKISNCYSLPTTTEPKDLLTKVISLITILGLIKK